jgi:hypothetical protein
MDTNADGHSDRDSDGASGADHLQVDDQRNTDSGSSNSNRLDCGQYRYQRRGSREPISRGTSPGRIRTPSDLVHTDL